MRIGARRQEERVIEKGVNRENSTKVWFQKPKLQFPNIDSQQKSPMQPTFLLSYRTMASTNGNFVPDTYD